MTKTTKKSIYQEPNTEVLLVLPSTLLAGSLRVDGTSIIEGGTETDGIEEGDGRDANAKFNRYLLWKDESEDESDW